MPKMQHGFGFEFPPGTRFEAELAYDDWPDLTKAPIVLTIPQEGLRIQCEGGKGSVKISLSPHDTTMVVPRSQAVLTAVIDGKTHRIGVGEIRATR